MHLLERIYNSRKTLRSVLSDEWSVEMIHDFSLKELETMYITQKSNTYIDSGCNFTLTNRLIPSHKLHVIYYNFPELHRTGTKINKTCCDKLTALYKKDGFDNEDSIFEPEDSLLVIINESISESIKKSVESMYLKGQNELLTMELSDDIQKEMKDSKFYVEKPYFRNVHIFHLDTLINNLMDHNLVPKHEVIRDKDEINKIFEMTNSNIYQLPIILRTDSIAKIIRLCPGDLCKITRKSSVSCSAIYYRICK